MNTHSSTAADSLAGDATPFDGFLQWRPSPRVGDEERGTLGEDDLAEILSSRTALCAV